MLQQNVLAVVLFLFFRMDEIVKSESSEANSPEAKEGRCKMVLILLLK